MQIETTERAAAVHYEQGCPTQLVWDEKQWRVLDVPTRIGAQGETVYSPFITHPPKPWPGWRFTAGTDGGAAYVFDIRELSGGRCEVLRVYE